MEYTKSMQDAARKAIWKCSSYIRNPMEQDDLFQNAYNKIFLKHFHPETGTFNPAKGTAEGYFYSLVRNAVKHGTLGDLDKKDALGHTGAEQPDFSKVSLKKPPKIDKDTGFPLPVDMETVTPQDELESIEENAAQNAELERKLACLPPSDQILVKQYLKDPDSIKSARLLNRVLRMLRRL